MPWFHFVDDNSGKKLYVEGAAADAAFARIRDEYPTARLKTTDSELWRVTAPARFCKLAQGGWVDSPCKEPAYKKRYMPLDVFRRLPSVVVVE